MPWIPFHEDDELFDEERGKAGFVLDNDVDLKVVMPMYIMRLQLRQNQELVRNDRELVTALRDLTEQLRRRPVVYHTTNFSLFGRRD
jgi:hypothetical protein